MKEYKSRRISSVVLLLYIFPISVTVFMMYLALFVWGIDVYTGVLLLAGVYFLSASIERFYADLVDSYHLILHEEKLEGRKKFGRKEHLSYQDIGEIKSIRSIGFYFIKLQSRNNEEHFIRTSADIDNFGEFVEEILKRAENCTFIDLGKFPEKHNVWRKDPDLDLIEMAKKRAEENANKKDATNTEEKT